MIPILFTKSNEIHSWRSRLQDSSSLALVPTMGALHRGHVNLMNQASSQANNVVVSIFVNPLQFDDQDDLAGYPRTLEADIELCHHQGVTAVFAPTVDQVYQATSEGSIPSGRVGDLYEGEHRRGHFSGVLTVVHRLFEIVSPSVAIFGEKDYQQLVLIRQMSAKLHPNIRVASVPTVRDVDGLAISSRNSRLAASDRVLARKLFESLSAIESCFESGVTNARQLEETGRTCLNKFPQISIDYLVCVDTSSLLAIESVVNPAIVLLAATVGSVRLIDNILLTP